MKEAERKSDDLKEEMKSLEFQKENAFQSPPKEWIDHRLKHLHETLSKNTVASALALKGILGSIQLEAVSNEESDFCQIINGDEKKFKPYYVAHTKIQTLALLDERHKSSNWSHWRRGWDSFSPVALASPPKPAALTVTRFARSSSPGSARVGFESLRI